MIDKHQIISNLYSDAVSVSEIGGVFKAYDKDGKEISIVKSAIDAEYAKVEYKDKREIEYPSIADQLDDLYHNGIDGWKTTIKKTKDKYPKS